MMKVFPQKLEGMRGDLDKVEALLARERAQLHETETWRQKQEEEMRAEEAQLIRARQKSALVKNVKEHMATERELQATRRLQQEHEDEVLKLMEAVETARKSIAQHEADLEALRVHVASEEQVAQVRVGELERELVSERKLRAVAAGRVRPDVLKKYSAIKMRRGLAIVPVKNGTCQGCNMNIPPQLFNILQRGNSIELCGNCNRIIYWDKIMEEPESAAAQPPAAEPRAEVAPELDKD